MRAVDVPRVLVRTSGTKHIFVELLIRQHVKYRGEDDHHVNGGENCSPPQVTGVDVIGEIIPFGYHLLGARASSEGIRFGGGHALIGEKWGILEGQVDTLGQYTAA